MSLNLNSKQALQLIEELEKDKDNIKRVISFLDSKDVEVSYFFHPKSIKAKKSAESQRAKLEDIIKSLVFVGDEPLLVLVQGNKRVSKERLESIFQEKFGLASPERVKEITGYRVGSVSPFGQEIRAIIDQPIMERKTVRPAAGSTCLGVTIDPKDLKELTSARTEKISDF